MKREFENYSTDMEIQVASVSLKKGNGTLQAVRYTPETGSLVRKKPTIFNSGHFPKQIPE